MLGRIKRTGLLARQALQNYTKCQEDCEPLKDKEGVFISLLLIDSA